MIRVQGDGSRSSWRGGSIRRRLTSRGRSGFLRKRKDTKHFDPADAVRVKRNDRLKIVKIAPVTTRNQVEAEVKEAP